MLMSEERDNSGILILIVDDDDGLRRLVCRRLQKVGYAVADAVNGAGALTKIAGKMPALLLLDQKLPDMTGRSVIEKLMESGNDIPFIIMTGQGDERLAVDMMKFGARDYLVKDTDFLDHLPGVIDRVLRAIATEKRLAESEREKERLQQQLIQAQKLESVGRLAGGVAHDFNNMLGVIIGFAELAQQKISDQDKLLDYLEQIRRAAGRSADLTRQLLAFARKQTVMPEVIDIHKAITEMLKILRQLIGENIELVFKASENGLFLRIDRSQVDQILTNLCINARDAISGNGRIEISTSLKSADDEFCARHNGAVPGSEYVTVTITDNGCGMDEEALSHLFEPFYTTKVIGRGTGLGLATIYGIMQQNHGFIDVVSQPANGSSFALYFPVCEQPAAGEIVQSHEICAVKDSAVILLVEDEQSVLSMTEMMLEHLGFKVLAAISANEALKHVNNFTGHIDLLLTDIIMPGTNGHDLARQILEVRPEIRILFMSGYTADVVIQHGFNSIEVDFIQKPFDLPSLKRSIHKALAVRNGQVTGV